MQEELGIANIQQAFFEYRASFKEPITPFWHGKQHGELINAMLKALSPWRVSLENISWNQSAKNLGETQLTFALPALFSSVQLGIAGVTANAINPDWSNLSQFISLFQTAVDTLKAIVAQEFQSQQTTLGFHVTPGGKPFRETLSQFVNAKALGAEDATMFGVSAYFSDFSFVIDGSAAFPDSVFVKLIRIFQAPTRFEEMAGTIYKDEETVLRRLGLKLQ
jgi:hypothetical protein